MNQWERAARGAQGARGAQAAPGEPRQPGSAAARGARGAQGAQGAQPVTSAFGVNQNESVFAGRNYFISPAFRCRNDPPVRLVAQFCNILKNHAFRQFRLHHCFAIHSHLLNRWGTQL